MVRPQPILKNFNRIRSGGAHYGYGGGGGNSMKSGPGTRSMVMETGEKEAAEEGAPGDAFSEKKLGT
jgi:hypothetical protein